MTASTYTSTAPRFPGAAAVAVVIWVALAIAAGASGFLLRLPFPGPQLIILALVALTLAVGLVRGPVRDWIDALPLRTLIGVNAVRFIGITFLVLAARGQLNPVFAARAGWGDIAVAIVAIILVVFPARRAIIHAWNALGFLDLVVAVATATVVTIQGTTPGVSPVLTLPLSIVPTVFVPLFLANHVFIFRRLRGEGR
ncbi:MAG TPA: hypothetical protein VGQ29_15005 [Gemmatimonadales bacterium]|jgi:hypothetical protein|nr:hypothetical protein [Gemmatimonadales bacterium]